MTNEEKIKNVQQMFEDILIKDIESQSITIYGTAILDVIEVLNLIEKQSKEIEELKKDKLELINKYHVVHLKDVEKELREMRKAIDTKNVEIECLNVIHESYKEMVAENNYISKDKIKAILKKYRNKKIEYAPDFYKEIQSLLEEE